ncbi:hypothetical protein D9756_007267 [Leucocoprinus leucothites]|uniref:Protein kinase domain-containing protein n=1 Tax=Leucocoprinus leucothites TaxID=201217 RepID=A0A8H5D669_9AGAR|nr:hypothetical protein D9756_007267 [Leucoagaricus leucothites]
MVSSQSEQDTSNTVLNAPIESDIFAFLHELVSRIDTENHKVDVVDKARSLQPEEAQLLVDCLSMALDKDVVPLKNRAHVWSALIKVASSTKLIAHNHTLNREFITLESETFPDVYRVSGTPSGQVRVRKRSNNNSTGLHSEKLISWVHLLHPNILPLYAVFFEDDERLCLVSPSTTDVNVCDYARGCSGALRLSLASDIVAGMYYLHQIDIVHGGLHPQCVVVTNDGRALITELDFTPETRSSDSSLVRYSTPELLEGDDIQPTKATDMWTLACLFYEILSGNVPFCQIDRDFRVSAAIAKGYKPARPGREGFEGDEIDDTMWQLMLRCWEYEPENRLSCLDVRQVFLGMAIQDGRPEVEPIIGNEACRNVRIDLEGARARLAQVLGSDNPSPLRVPGHLSDLLLRLTLNTNKFDATAAASNKLSPDDTQGFVDFLELVLEDFPQLTGSNFRAIRTLLSKIMISTLIIPRCYKLNGLQYDPTPVTEGHFGKAYKGRGLNNIIKGLPNWSRLSHPNVIPFYGVFYEGTNESLRICLVTPLWKNGNLRQYAPSLPQKSRLLLISDILKGLVYLHGLGIVYGSKPLIPECVLISDEGQAMLAVYGAIFIETGTATLTSELRYSPAQISSTEETDIWSFGCLCYEILSRKPPYYQYVEDAEIRSAVSRGELPKRPDPADNDIDEINDGPQHSTGCLRSRKKKDSLPETKDSAAASLMVMKSPRPNVDFHRMEILLDQIQIELLRDPLSKIVQNRIKEVAVAAVGELGPDDTRTLVNFLDLALKDYLSISEERNRVLALLSRITSSTRIFPEPYELKYIKYDSMPIAEGGFGTVHQASDPTMCVKVMTRVDPKALTEWIKELIIWAHTSHPNVLPFYGVFLEDDNGYPTQRISLVSPYMKNKNLQDYAPRLPQKSRFPLILDDIYGLQYIHGSGIVHGDLKGQNVLISNEGRGLITDFGASHIVTSTFATTGSSVFSTLRFAAPEVILSGPRWQPTRECDIWSFGCLCLEVLSRKVPYHEYKLSIQVQAALARKDPPKRPGSIGLNEGDELNDDEDDEEDWDEIDDRAWNLITKCCAPDPEDRLHVLGIQELLADMKIWDERPTAKPVFGAEIYKRRSNPSIDLNRVSEVLDRVRRVVTQNVEPDPDDNFSSLFNSL